MCILQFDLLIGLYLFMSFVCNASFLIIKNSGVRGDWEEPSKGQEEEDEGGGGGGGGIDEVRSTPHPRGVAPPSGVVQGNS